MKTLIALLMPIFSYGQWTQLGESIAAEAAGDQSGYAVSLSGDGNVIAIGERFNDTNGSASGQVRIFENQSGAWVQKGSALNGMKSEDKFGSSVSLNSDGNILAVGAPDSNINGFESGEVRMYHYVSGDWEEMGIIEGDAWGDHSGLSISLNDAGNILSVGAPDHDGPDTPPYDTGSNFGQVRIFENTTGTWTQIANLLGARAEDNFGFKTQLNALGDIVMIGAPNYDLDESNPHQESGQVVVYQNTSNIWEIVNGPINGQLVTDELGESISINDTGDIIALSLVNDGIVRIYESISGEWIQKGSDIVGEIITDNFGFSIALNGAGNVIAIGGYLNGGSFSEAGHVRVFEFQSGDWIQIHSDIDGETNQERSGYSVSINNDGDIIAIGAYLFKDNGASSGITRIFINDTPVVISGLRIAKIPELNRPLVYPNPATEEITVRFEKSYSAVKITIFDFKGRQINHEEYENSNQLSLRLDTYPTGLYLLKFQTDEAAFTTSLIKK